MVGVMAFICSLNAKESTERNSLSTKLLINFLSWFPSTEMIWYFKRVEFSGSTYSVSGSGVTADGNINPSYTDLQTTLNGQDYTWKQVDLNTRPNWNLNQNGASFQFTEVYKQPSVSRITDLTRQITSESVTETTTVFSQ